MEDDHRPPVFERAQQNIAATAMLVRRFPEASTPEAKKLHEELRTLLDRVAAQQAESSTQCRGGTLTGDWVPPPQEASVHHTPRHAPDAVRIPVQACVGEARDICHTLDARRRGRADRDEEQEQRHGRHPRRGGRYDEEEDRSPSPKPMGPRCFSLRINTARFPPCFKPPTSILKYAGEMNLGLWLEDYRLACWAGGAEDNYFIIRHLPLYLSNSVHTWLEHLPEGKIRNWSDLKEIFVGNFQGTYVRPGNP